MPPIAAGFMQEQTGSATAPILFATAMMFAVLCLHGVFRFEQRRLVAAQPEPRRNNAR